MKIRHVEPNNRKKCFEVIAFSGREFEFPFLRCDPCPSSSDRVATVYVDAELGKEAFTYELESGNEGSIHIDSVLEINNDLEYMADLQIHDITAQVRRCFEQSGVPIRQVSRSLGTSPSQIYRMLDERHSKKWLRQLLMFLHVLECELEFSVMPKVTRRGRKKRAG